MKRNKIFKSLIVIFILLCSISILFACGDEDSDAPSTGGGSNKEGLRVIFMDGDTKLNEVTTLEEYLAYVNVPTKEGYEIEGWYLDFDLTEKLAGNPSGKVTLYVNWKIKTYTVRFINYDGTAIPVNGENYQTVEHGQSAKAPEENPTREGYVFDGWDKDFSIITSNTQIRPKYSKPSYSVILYGQDGTTVVKEEVVEIGTDLADLMGDYVKYARANTLGGFTYEGLCADKELTTVFIYPEKMPAENVVMYTKVGLQGIENVKVVSNRLDNAYRYDKEGFELTGSFSESDIAGLTYSYKWISGGVEIAGANDKILTIGVKDVGEYYYDFVVTATYGNLEPQVASASILVTVNPGLLNMLPEEEQIGYKWGTNLVYTGKEVTPTFTNLKDGDVVYYKKSSENDYSTTSPVKNAEDNAYSIDIKVERPNYSPLVFEDTSVRIKKAELTANIILGDATSQKGENSEEGNYNVYSIEYGSALPQAEVAVSGFVNDEKQGNILKWSDENFDRTYILNTDYDQTASVLEEGKYYTLALDRATWKTPQNYTFSEASWSNVINIKVLKKSLVLRVQSRQITYGDERPDDSEFETLIGAEDGTTGLPLAGFEDTIKEIIAKSYVCEYTRGDDVDQRFITLNFKANNTKLTETERNIINCYDVTINEGFLIVNPKAVTIKFENITLTYGDAVPNPAVEKDENVTLAVPTYTYTISGLLEDDTLGTAIHAVCDYKFKSQVDEYPITFKIDNQNKHYIVTAPQDWEPKVTVVKKKATLTLGDKYIKYYDEIPSKDDFIALLTAEGLVADVKDGDNIVAKGDVIADLATNPSFSVEYNAGSDVGEYVVSVGGYASNNYILDVFPGKLIVEQAEMTISIDDATIVYGEAYEPKVNYVGLFGDEKEDPSKAFQNAGSIVVGYNVGDNVGTYEACWQNASAKNYSINYVEGQITVVPRAITIEARGYVSDDEVNEENKGHWIVDFANINGKCEILGQGLYVEDALTGVLQTNSNIAGAYILIGEMGENAKFEWTTPLTISNGVEQKNDNYIVSYNLQIAIKTYGILVTTKEIVYDGMPHGVDVEQMFKDNPMAEVWFSVDNVTFQAEPILFTDEGKYPLYYQYCIYDENGVIVEYEKEEEPAIVTITPRTINVIVDSKTITYGDAEPEFTYTLTSYAEDKPMFAEGEDASVIENITIVPQEYIGNSGTYKLVAEGSTTTSNYKLAMINATYVVKRKDLTVSAKSYSISYGDTIPTFESDVAGLVKGETIESLGNILYTCDFTADKEYVAGEYDVVPKLSLDNYNVIAVNGKLLVAKRAITLTASALSIFYNAEEPTLVAKSSFYGYNDDITTIGTFDIACSYEKGNDAGSYAITLANFVSDKYTATLKNGTLTVKPYETKASWSSAVSGSYVYDGSDRSSLFTATFLDVNGDEHVATITFSASNSTPNAFKNAGTYTITASTSDKNYKITDATKKVTIAKASYTSAEAHSGFTGVYSPKKTLADYKLNSNYYWTAPASTPVVNTTEYDAYYNADIENYKNYPITISLVLTPALVSLSSDGATVQEAYDFAGQIDTASTNLSQTFSVSTTAYWVDENGLVEAINAGYTIRYSNGTTFGAGSHMTVMTFSSENYKLNVSDSGRIEESEGIFSTSVKYFVKFRGVEYSGTLYTPEEALNVASSGTITVKNNTSFATDSEVIARYYNTSAYTTLKSGVTFLIPYSVDDTKGNLEGGEKDASSGDYNAHPTIRCNEATPVLYLTVTIPACSTLNVNGTLIVGALTGSTVTGTYQNGITGNYSRILLEGNIVATAGTVKVFGYVLGSGKITASGSAQIIENMYVTGWSGGTVSSVKYLGTRTLDIDAFVLAEENQAPISFDDPYAFAFNEYELRAVQTRMEINYGASLKAFIKIATSEQSYTINYIIGTYTYTIKAKISEAYMTLISSGTGDNGGILELSSGAKVTKTMANDRVRLELEGSVSDGYGIMNMPVLKANVQLKTANVLFPIDGRTDVVVKSGSTFTQDYKFKLLPGATLTVEAGATYNVNGSTIVYNDNYYDFDGHPKPYTQGRGDAKLIVNGTMNVNGAFGGNVISTGAGKVVVASGATLSVYSYEIQTGKIARDGLSIVTTATEGNSQTLAMTIGGATAVAGTTYNYNGTAWA